MTFQPGSRAILHIAPVGKKRYEGEECTIETIGECRQGPLVASVRFDDGEYFTLFASFLRPVQTAKTPRRSPLRLTPDKDTRTEAQKQAEGISWLRDHGYKVLVVGQYMKRIQCEKCGEWQWPKGFGNSPGYPDLSISHPSHWAEVGRRRPVLLIEFKRNEKEPKRTQEQLDIAAAGISGIVWSLPMLLSEVYAFEQEWIQAGPHPDIVSWLQRHNLLPEAEAAG